jgi:hypothetical protein
MRWDISSACGRRGHATVCGALVLTAANQQALRQSCLDIGDFGHHGPRGVCQSLLLGCLESRDAGSKTLLIGLEVCDRNRAAAAADSTGTEVNGVPYFAQVLLITCPGA